MDDLKTFIENLPAIILAFFGGLAAFKHGVGLLEFPFKFFGIETKGMRKRREQAEQQTKNTNDIKDLKENHEKDIKEITSQINDIKTLLTDFTLEIRDSVAENHKEIQHFYDKQLEFKGESVNREQRLNNRINSMSEKDDSRDVLIENIGKSLEHLTEMFVEKEINDYRWEIINFASNVAAKKPCTKDAYVHCFKTYEKYEKVLEENNMENGEVEISMEVVNESYKKKLIEGFDNE